MPTTGHSSVSRLSKRYSRMLPSYGQESHGLHPIAPSRFSFREAAARRFLNRLLPTKASMQSRSRKAPPAPFTSQPSITQVNLCQIHRAPQMLPLTPPMSTSQASSQPACFRPPGAQPPSASASSTAAKGMLTRSPSSSNPAATHASRRASASPQSPPDRQAQSMSTGFHPKRMSANPSASSQPSQGMNRRPHRSASCQKPKHPISKPLSVAPPGCVSVSEGLRL